uniref:Dynein light chain Tctex-type 1 n=1 Tax=Phaeomonas parva TaxID=124430 RepID=A0A7S1TPC0_9STRA|mmetsp:Transcript_11644/g.35356  ORF Transcript_11644/g.35356 Transcript_11644/m.35356 type:complete len:124 (+) Transcript_11644:139-510(+)|eukprot:CAMPEP_0118867158 /NCGR_PEP_ID=MMETSP1163-20130328/10844_1 /TAXON_ID=124430 /ORGANISM="Phaeomonas parva, Strain CCMP2877" /LENGTH=123 /DNA_ID=CAMNT_0006801539 /DNA_START=117 /DNA_END=488 /DNA_ORIENTATION=-
MDDLGSSEELAFTPEQVESMLYQVITQVIGQSVYDDAKVAQWVDEINDRCMEMLVELTKPFKYTVTTFIMQRNGAGLHSSHSCFWDMATDNIAQANWPNDKHRDQHNNRMYVVVTVFAAAMTK